MGIGHRAAVDKVTANDYQATLLHQFGLDHEQLTFHHGGQSQCPLQLRQRASPARVVKEIVGEIKFPNTRRPPSRPPASTESGFIADSTFAHSG